MLTCLTDLTEDMNLNAVFQIGWASMPHNFKYDFMLPGDLMGNVLLSMFVLLARQDDR